MTFTLTPETGLTIGNMDGTHIPLISSIDMQNINGILNLRNPIEPGDATTLSFVNNLTLGLNILDPSATSQSLAPQQAYIAMNNSTPVTFTMPLTMPAGGAFRLQGFGDAGWIIDQQDGQQFFFGDSQTTVGTGGSLASTQGRDCIDVVCVVENTSFLIFSAIGNLAVI